MAQTVGDIPTSIGAPVLHRTALQADDIDAFHPQTFVGLGQMGSGGHLGHERTGHQHLPGLGPFQSITAPPW
jgi:hypothetical protein